MHPSYWHSSVIAGVAKVIGTLVTIERATSLRHTLIDARFIANIDISKPLRKEVEIKIEDKRTWIQPIFYENIPVQCGICKSFDHYAKDFPKKRAQEEERRNQTKIIYANKNEGNDWKIVKKGKGWKNRTNTKKHTTKTLTKTSDKPYKESRAKSNPLTKNPYVVLGVLEGIDRENIEYNTNFFENEAIDMEVMK